jgi:glucan phosphoethanolaminetransferase (alkaline phosphatase superfamily)
MAQQEAVKYKELCQEILNTTMQEMRKFNEMADQLLHEQLQQTNNYKELCAHMLHLDNALLKEIDEILDQESKDLVLDKKAKPEECSCHP